MDMTDAIALAEALIFMKTGKHLDHVQKAVVGLIRESALRYWLNFPKYYHLNRIAILNLK